MKNKLTRIIAAVMAAGIMGVAGTSYAAGTASFAVSSASVTTGSNTTVYISEDGDNVSAVTVSYTYDTSMLQLVGSSCTGAFPNPIGSTTCYITPGNTPVSGAQDVMALTFKGISAGSASVTVTGSQIASNGVNAWDGNSASGAITVSAPAPTQPAPTTSSSSTSSNGSGSKSTASSSSTNKTTASTSTPTSSSTPTTSSTSATQTPVTKNSQVKTSTTKNTKVKKLTPSFKLTSNESVSTDLIMLVAVSAVIGYFVGARKLPKLPKPAIKASLPKRKRA